MKTKYIIKKQVIELILPSENDFWDIQNRVTEVYKKKVLPLFKTYCEQLCKEDYLYRIEKIHIDIGEINSTFLEKEFLEKVGKLLYRELKQRIKLVNENITNELEKSYETFELLTFFIKTGQIPWWVDITTNFDIESILEEFIRSSPKKLKELLQIIMSEKKYIIRFIKQFSDNVLLNILQQLNKELLPEVKILNKALSNTNSIRLLFWEKLFFSEYSLSDKTKENIDNIKWDCQKIISDNNKLYRDVDNGEIIEALGIFRADITTNFDIESILEEFTRSSPKRIEKLLQNIETERKYIIRFIKQFSDKVLFNILQQLNNELYNEVKIHNHTLNNTNTLRLFFWEKLFFNGYSLRNRSKTNVDNIKWECQKIISKKSEFYRNLDDSKHIEEQDIYIVDSLSVNSLKLKQNVTDELEKSCETFELLAFFIKTGETPWWIEITTKFDIESILEEFARYSPKKFEELLQNIETERKYIIRFIKQFSDKVLFNILQQLNNELYTEVKIHNHTLNNTNTLRLFFWEKLFFNGYSLSDSNKTNVDNIKWECQKIISDKSEFYRNLDDRKNIEEQDTFRVDILFKKVYETVKDSPQYHLISIREQIIKIISTFNNFDRDLSNSKLEILNYLIDFLSLDSYTEISKSPAKLKEHNKEVNLIPDNNEYPDNLQIINLLESFYITGELPSFINNVKITSSEPIIEYLLENRKELFFKLLVKTLKRYRYNNIICCRIVSVKASILKVILDNFSKRMNISFGNIIENLFNTLKKKKHYLDLSQSRLYFEIIKGILICYSLLEENNAESFKVSIDRYFLEKSDNNIANNNEIDNFESLILHSNYILELKKVEEIVFEITTIIEGDYSLKESSRFQITKKIWHCLLKLFMESDFENIEQLNNDTKKIFNEILGEYSHEQDISNEISKLTNNNITHLIKILFDKSIHHTLIQRKLAFNSLQHSNSRNVLQQNTKPINDFSVSDKIYVPNSGIVIIAPFIFKLFDNLGLILDKSFISKEEAIKGAFLLNYISSDINIAPEYLMQLNKVLCGLKFEDPIDILVDITANEINEVDKLIYKIIQGWSALKKISPDGLRELFIQREGLLSRKNGNWLLEVERKGQDILLEKIPWQYKIIKLPWMDDIIFVEW